MSESLTLKICPRVVATADATSMDTRSVLLKYSLHLIAQILVAATLCMQAASVEVESLLVVIPMPVGRLAADSSLHRRGELE
jgi:hypothetical protein